MVQLIDYSKSTRSLFIILVCILPIIPGVIYYLMPKENRTKKHRHHTVIVSGITTGISVFGLGYYFSNDFIVAIVVAMAAAAGMFYSMKNDFKTKGEIRATVQFFGTENKHIKSKRKLIIIGYSTGIFALVLILLNLFASISPLNTLVCLGPVFLMILILILNKKNLRIK